MTLQAPDQVLKNAVLLDLNTMDKGDVQLNALYQLNLQWDIHQSVTADKLMSAITDKQIVVSNKVVIGQKQMQQVPALKLICVAATGTNNIDLKAARELGIDVCNVTGYATPSVVQYVFSVLLTLNSRMQEYQAAVQQGRWPQSKMFCLLDYSFHELAGKTLGIVGYGELGQAVAAVARGFGMEVLIARRNKHDSRDNRLELEQMLTKVDVLSLHCPLTAETENLIAKKQLSLLPQGAIVINTARGGVVNEGDLLAALESGHLAGAATDVLTTEPPAKDHLLLKTARSNLIVTPHIAWASVESRQRMIDQVALNISEYLAGRPRNIVN